LSKKIIILVAVVSAIVAAAAIAWIRLYSDGRGERTQLVLYCGAGIRPGVAALIEAFGAKSNVRIIPTYEGSGQSLGKITAGSGGDLFMPGAEFFVDKAIEKGLASKESKRIVAYFVPVLLVQKDNPKGIHSLKDLTRNGIRVGLGDERSAAVGQVTLEILKKNAISYDDVAKNVVYKSGTGDELGVAVQMGTVDVVVLWDVNARYFLRHGQIVPIPPRQNVPSAIPIAILKSTRHEKEANEFVQFTVSPEGRRIMEEKGFTVDLRAATTQQAQGD